MAYLVSSTHELVLPSKENMSVTLYQVIYSERRPIVVEFAYLHKLIVRVFAANSWLSLTVFWSENVVVLELYLSFAPPSYLVYNFPDSKQKLKDVL